MLTYYEQIFWNNIKEENLKAIDILLENNYDLSAAKLIFTAIDTLAGFFAGRLSQDSQVKNSFIDLLRKYGPQYFRHDLSQLRRSANKQTFKNYAQVLYYVFRNGLIHDSSLGIGVSIYRDRKDRTLFRSNGAEIMELNIITFYEQFKEILKTYENDLQSEKTLYKKWQAKYQEINSPIFELDIKERIFDELRGKGRITSREVEQILNQSRSTALRILKRMITKGLIQKEGGGTSTYYMLKGNKNGKSTE